MSEPTAEYVQAHRTLVRELIEGLSQAIGEENHVTFDESSMWQFAEKYGAFTLDFGETDERGLWINPAELRRPDAMPWTLTFTKESGETADWTHHFAGSDLPSLFQWAADFIDGRVDEHGRPIGPDTGSPGGGVS